MQATHFHSDVHDIERYTRLYWMYNGLDQDIKDKIDQWGKYGFWALDHSHPREDRLAMVLEDLGIYIEPPRALESDEMTGGAEEYDEIMAAHDLMNVR